MLSSVKSMISSPFTVGLGGADVENHNETLKKPTLQKICSSASKFSGSPKTKQYTAGYPDKKSVSNWNEFGLGRKDSYTVNHPMAISKEMIVGMKFKKTEKARKVECLTNLIGRIVHLEYINKLARREAN